MTISTFPWDDVGQASDIKIKERCHTHRTPYTAGYEATRARATKKQKIFTVSWRLMRTAQWLELIEFWRSVGSSDAFYFEFPVALYDAGAYGGEDVAEPPDGFDSEGDGTGWGDGARFLVRFLNDEMEQGHIKPFYWGIEIVIEEVA